ncbi:12715_t:CDS:2, partial [Entrophospora sp. SA101]
WNQEPSLRPNMPTFLTQLATLYRNYYYSPHILPKPRVNNYNDSGIGKEITPLRDDDDLSLDTLTLDDAPKAALKGHEKSIKKLQSLNISIYGD